MPPAAFIPFAEQIGFTHRLTLWMFEEVVRQTRALGVAQMSISLSTRDPLDQVLPEKRQALLARHDARADPAVP